MDIFERHRTYWVSKPLEDAINQAFTKEEAENSEFYKKYILSGKIKKSHFFMFFSKMHTKYTYQRKEYKTRKYYVHIASTMVGKWTGGNFLKPMKEIMVKYGIIQCNEIFVPKVFSKSYRFTQRYRHILFEPRICPHNTIKYELQKNIPIIEHFDKVKKRVKFDFGGQNKEEIVRKIYPLIDNLYEQEEKIFYLLQNIDLIEQYPEYIECDFSEQTNRLFSNFTNLKREVRSYLTIDGQKLAEVDIKSSQPFLMSLLYPDKTIPEAIKYIEWTTKGDFYELVRESFGRRKNKVRRDTLKQRFYYYLFGKMKNGLYSYKARAIHEIFCREFPILAKIVDENKKDDHRKLAVLLQRMEAEIMIDTVALECAYWDIPIITIHDGILCLHKDLNLVTSMIEKAFMTKYGISPKFKQTLF